MLATPTPVTTPPISRRGVVSSPKPTMNSPTMVTATAISMLSTVSGTLSRICWPGTL